MVFFRTRLSSIFLICATAVTISHRALAESDASCVSVSEAQYRAATADLSDFYAAATTGPAISTFAPPPQPGRVVRVIISFHGQLSELHLNQIIPWPGTITHRLDTVNAVSAIVPVNQISAVSHNPLVRAIELDAPVQAFQDDSEPRQVLPLGVKRTHAPQTWSKTRGEGVTVAIIDTGIDSEHPDLAGRVVGGYDFTSGDDSHWRDDHGHGTHVSGIIAADDNNEGVVGVAPKASLLAVKVLSTSGAGTYSDVVAGIEWATASKARIANMSLGGTADIEAMHEALKKAHNRGLLITAAAGNSGEEGNPLNYPAAYPEVVSVAAVDDQDTRAYFSTYNKYVAIAAPGVNVLSLGLDGRYARMSGTSMASPHVAGVAALLLSLFPSEDVKSLKRRLVCNADTRWPGSRNVWTGYGIVDAESAIRGTRGSEACDYLSGDVREPTITRPITHPAPPTNSNVAFIKSTAFNLINGGNGKKQLVVTAKLLDSKGKPIANATVTSEIMERTSGPLAHATARTNSAGEAQFVLTGFTCGHFTTHVVESSAPGFSDKYGQPEAEVEFD